MAIKLQVQEQLGGRSSIPEATPIQRGTGFGNVGLVAGQVPTEDISGNMAAMMRTGQAANQAAQSWAQSFSSIHQQIQGHMAAEDDRILAQTAAQTEIKRNEISAKNLERVQKGEITYMQLAEENAKEFQALHQSTVDGLVINDNRNKDSLMLKFNVEQQRAYQSDLAYGVKENTRQNIDAFNLSVDNLARKIEKGGPSAFDSSSEEMTALYKSPIVGAIGVEKVKNMVLEKVSKGIDINISNALKANPEKFLNDMNEGLYDKMMTYKSEDEKTIIRNSAFQEISKLQETEKAAYDKQQQEALDYFKLDIEKQNIPNENDFEKFVSGLKPDKQIEARKMYRTALGDTDEYRNKIRDAQRELSLDITGAGLSKDHRDVLIQRDPEYNDALLNSDKTVIYAKKVVSRYGQMNDALLNTISMPPRSDATPEQQNLWATNILDMKSYSPRDYEKLPESTKRAATIMKYTGASYTGASEKYKQLDAEKDVENIVGKLPKDWDITSNPRGKIADSIPGIDEDNISDGMIDRVKNLIQIERLYNDNEKEATEAAIKKSYIGSVEDSSGNKTAMFYAPSTVIKQPELLPYFYNSVKETIIKNNTEAGQSIKNWKLIETPNTSKEKPSYYALDEYNRIIRDKDGKEVMITVDENKYNEQRNQDLTVKKMKDIESSWYNNLPWVKNEPTIGAQILPKVKPRVNPSTIDQTMLRGEINRVQDKYPLTVNKYPNLMYAIAATESGGNPNIKNSPKDAQGLMQMLPSTAKQYGANPKNKDESILASTKYMDELIKSGKKLGTDYAWNDTDILNFAIISYNWGPGNASKFVKNNNGKIVYSKLPDETIKHLAHTHLIMETLG